MFGYNRTRGDLRSAIYLLYKTGYVIQQPQKKNDEYIFTTHLPESDLIMSKKVDAILANRLKQLCKLHNTSFVFELVNQLLINSCTKEQLKVLIANAQTL